MIDLREKRQAAGLTPDQLASELGVSVRTVFRWEAGDSAPRIDQAPGLARALGIGLEDLFGTHASDGRSVSPGCGNEDGPGAAAGRRSPEPVITRPEG